LKVFKKTYITFVSLLLVLSLLALPVQAAVIDEVRDLIKNKYVDEIDEKILQAPTVEDILKQLDDPYTSYLTAEQYNKFLNSLGDKSFSGLGIQMEKVEKGMLILRVFSGSPAEEVNLKPGDIIVSVDGKSITDMAVENAVLAIRGPEGSKIDLVINRLEKIISVSTIRRSIVLPSVEGELFPGKIGYIDIDSFGSETPAQFKHTLDDLRLKGAESYIIDLRNNGGGLLSAAFNIAGYFLENDIVLNTKTRGIERSFLAKSQGTLVDKPVIFLVNEYSASASEILTAAVKDNNKALVIGNTTFGKGCIQTIYQLHSENSFLKLTTARFFSPRGNIIDRTGITPDLLINESDPLEAAKLLLGYTEYSDNIKNVSLTLRIGRFPFTIDTRMASSTKFWPVYSEIISQLPDYTLCKTGTQTDWGVIDPEELKSMWPLFYVNYLKIGDFNSVPVDKKFCITIQGSIDKPNINNKTVELIEINSGNRIQLDLTSLGSNQFLVSPCENLEYDKKYWLVVHPLLDYSGKEIFHTGYIANVSVKSSNVLEKTTLSIW